VAIVETWERPGVNESEWDRLYLGDKLIPGVADVEAYRQKVLDVKVRRGRDGARVKDRGIPPQTVIISIRMLPEHLREYAEIMQGLLPRRGEPRGPVTIAHPATDMLDITAIELERVGTPRVRRGIGEAVIDAIEWMPEPKKRRDKDSAPEDTLGKAFADYQADVYGVHDSFTIPTWQRAGSPFLSYQPPSTAVDLNALEVLGGTTPTLPDVPFGS